MSTETQRPNNRSVTDSQASEIRHRANDGEGLKELSTAFGVSKSTIYSIIRGTLYRHVGGPLKEKTQSRSKRERLSDEQVVEIREDRHNNGTSHRVLAERFGVSPSTITRVINHTSYPDIGGPRKPPSAQPWRDISNDEAREIRESYHRDGLSQTKVAKKHGLTPLRVRRILVGQSHPDAGGPIGQVDKSRHQKKLSEGDVVKIRELYDTKQHTQADLAERFQVNQTAISGIVTGKSYPEYGGPITPTKKKRPALGEPIVVEIRERHHYEGEDKLSLARRFGIRPEEVVLIVAGRTYKAFGGPTGPGPASEEATDE